MVKCRGEMVRTQKSPADQARCRLRTAGAQKTARVVAFASAKGGVGKTSLLANLAFEIADMGQRVLVIDANLGLANIDTLFGLAPHCGLDDFFAGRCALKDVLVEGPRGIHVMPAGSATPELSTLTTDQKRAFLQALDVFHDRYDLVLIDTAAGIADNLLTFCAASEHLVVVTTPEPAALAETHALMTVLARRRGEKRFHLLLNQVDDDEDAARVYRRLVDLCEDLPDVSLSLLGCVPFDRRLTAALRRLQPVARVHPASSACKAQSALAKRLVAFGSGPHPKGGLQFFWARFLSGNRRS